MRIVTDTITISELNEMAKRMRPNLVKAMVDVEKGVLAVDAGMHADLMELLIETEGVNPETTWGFNLIPDKFGDDFIEFDSMMNIKPASGNPSREVQSEEVRKQIRDIVNKHLVP